MAPRRRLLLASQPLDGGVAHHVLDLVGGLDRDRWAIEVACPRSSVVWARLADDDRVRLHEIPPDREPAVADFASLGRLLPLVRRADVVHGHSSKAGFLVRLAALVQRRRRTCVFTPHGWSFWSAAGTTAALYRSLERAAAHWCGRIVTLSENERAAGLGAAVGHPSQYRVIPNGVDVARFSTDPRPVPGRIVWLGRLASPKRPDLVVRAFANVHRRLPHARLELIGDGPARDDLERLAGTLGVANALRFLGTRDDVPALLAEATCLVLASDYEGCPLSVIEAMAAGVPVVATAVGGVPELVEHGRVGWLTPAGDAAALGGALEQVLRDPSGARSAGERARELARERYSLTLMVARTAALYEEVDEEALERPVSPMTFSGE